MVLKLYKLLFVEQQISLNVNSLALVQKDGTYVLYDSSVLNAIKLPPPTRNGSTKVNLSVDHVFVAGIIARSAKEQGLGDCNNALTVRLSVRNPEYKSAGILLYKIVSSVNKRPLISDRERSTSELAKQVWKRFEKDPQAKQIDLDNFMGQDQYVDLSPTGDYVQRTGPKTSSQTDDCKVNDIAKSLGHPESFIFNVDTSVFTTNHTNVVQNTLPRLGLTEETLFQKLETTFHNSFYSQQ